MSNAIAELRFREIVLPLLDDAYSLAKWLSHSPTDAEDIVQDAALRALQALSTVSVDRPKPWFLAIVRNAAMTFMARNRRKTVAYVGDMADLDTLDLPQGDEAASNPEQELITIQDGERLRQAIVALPSPFLETLVMRDINGLSYREIAEDTANAGPGTGKAAGSPATRHLAEHLRGPATTRPATDRSRRRRPLGNSTPPWTVSSTPWARSNSSARCATMRRSPPSICALPRCATRFAATRRVKRPRKPLPTVSRR